MLLSSKESIKEKEKEKEWQHLLSELRREAIETLCSLMLQLGSDFAIFVPMISKVLVQQNISDYKVFSFSFSILKQ
jgi:hypothetical protein